jgi:hypothetical protein
MRTRLTLDLAAPKRLRKEAVAAVPNQKLETPATAPTPPLPTRNDANWGEPEHGVHDLTSDTAGRRVRGYDKAPRNLYEFRTWIAHLCMITRRGNGIMILAECRRIWQELYSNRQMPEGSACYISFTTPTCGAIRVYHC